MTWNAWYPYNEGTGTTLNDGAASPLNMAITAGGSGAWSSIAAGAGYDSNGTGYAGVTIGDTKIDTALTGSKTLTIEMVVQFPLTSGANEWLFGLTDYGGAGGVLLAAGIWFDEVVQIVSSGTGGIAGGVIGEWDTSGISSGAHVITIVVDTDGANAAARLKVYEDGVAAGTFTSSLNDEDTTFSVPATTVMRVATLDSFGSPITGSVYWFALANHAALEAEVLSRATALLLNNDADPAGGGGGGGVTASQSGLAFTGGMGGGFRKPSNDNGRWTRGRGERIWRKAA